MKVAVTVVGLSCGRRPVHSCISARFLFLDILLRSGFVGFLRLFLAFRGLILYMMMGDFKPPSWAGDPEPGLHLDIMKDGLLVGKYSVDAKPYYLFGRNPDAVDFPIDHVSCSRVHAALVHHKALKRAFLMDLGSTHGTFIGNKRLEPNVPQQIFPDTDFHFGASTRVYYLREAPKPESSNSSEKSKTTKAPEVVLPSSEIELETLTNYNTEQNIKLSQLVGLAENANAKKFLQKRKQVSFIEEEEVINLDEADPSVGKFQNLVATEVIIPAKRVRLDSHGRSAPSAHGAHRVAFFGASRSSDLYSDVPGSTIGLPNTAPEVEAGHGSGHEEHEAHHKKYAKEIWPGKHPHRMDVDD